MYIRNTFTASREDLERCAGRAKQAARIIREKDVLMECYLLGAHHTINMLINHGDGIKDEETFLTRLTAEWAVENGEPLEVWDE